MTPPDRATLIARARQEAEEWRADGPDEEFNLDQAAQFDAIAALLEAEAWQPIETAPRGSHKMILLHSPNNQRGAVDYGFWNTANGQFEVQTMAGWDAFTNYSYGHEPTHWRPLPAPPVTEAR